MESKKVVIVTKVGEEALRARLIEQKIVTPSAESFPVYDREAQGYVRPFMGKASVSSLKERLTKAGMYKQGEGRYRPRRYVEVVHAPS